MRIREPKTTALIFASGKMVVTGAKSEDDSKLASRKYARIIQKLGFNAKFTDFKIQNIVGSCDIKFPIRLEGLASRHHNFSSYEPELFPGLIYRMMKPKIVRRVTFSSSQPLLTVVRCFLSSSRARSSSLVPRSVKRSTKPSSSSTLCSRTSARSESHLFRHAVPTLLVFGCTIASSRGVVPASTRFDCSRPGFDYVLATSTSSHRYCPFSVALHGVESRLHSFAHGGFRAAFPFFLKIVHQIPFL